jgi:hypothetical protein
MFALYRKGKKPGQWRFHREVNIAGSLAGSISDQAKMLKPASKEAMPWDLSGEGLRKAVMEKFGVEGSPVDFRVVIDATWGREDALLLEIVNVFGYSYNNWTPLMLQMTELAEVGKRPNGPRTPIESVHFDESESLQHMHEFLYLQCGHALGEGRRAWGRQGFTNAALLWPDALTHLLSRAGFVRA